MTTSATHHALILLPHDHACPPPHANPRPLAGSGSWSARHPLDFRDSRDAAPQRWAKLKHHNGVAVYLEV